MARHLPQLPKATDVTGLQACLLKAVTCFLHSGFDAVVEMIDDAAFYELHQVRAAYRFYI